MTTGSQDLEVLTNKTILLISPQAWGKMFVSKHHYAIELAKLGNTVYFLNPPDEARNKKGKKIIIEPYDGRENLFLIHHRLSFPYNIKFHFIGLFHKLMKPHVKKILKQIGKPIDIVWSFDLGNLYPFRLFPKQALKIFHPVDEPLNPTAIHSAQDAQIIFSVTKEILNKYVDFPIPKYFINHGVADCFLEPLEINSMAKHPVRVGFSGNLLREDIDRNTLLEIIHDNPGIIFECWGSYQLRQSNIGGGESGPLKNFVRTLQEHDNVVLHGVVDARTLARELRRMDAFLICYDITKDQSKGTNYHKIMEYLSVGKLIVSNNVTTYAGKPEYIQMTMERDNNRSLPALFNKVIHELDEHNSHDAQKERINYARENAYSVQIRKIDKLIKLA